MCAPRSDGPRPVAIRSSPTCRPSVTPSWARIGPPIRENGVYDAVRRVLQDLGLDRPNIGKPTWNPLKDCLPTGSARGDQAELGDAQEPGGIPRGSGHAHVRDPSADRLCPARLGRSRTGRHRRRTPAGLRFRRNQAHDEDRRVAGPLPPAKRSTWTSGCWTSGRRRWSDGTALWVPTSSRSRGAIPEDIR